MPGCVPTSVSCLRTCPFTISLNDHLGKACQVLTSIDAKTSAGMHAGDATAAKKGHEIAHSNLNTFLSPSSIAAELRPDLTPSAAADIYTGAPTMIHT